MLDRVGNRVDPIACRLQQRSRHNEWRAAFGIPSAEREVGVQRDRFTSIGKIAPAAGVEIGFSKHALDQQHGMLPQFDMMVANLVDRRLHDRCAVDEVFHGYQDIIDEYRMIGR